MKDNLTKSYLLADFGKFENLLLRREKLLHFEQLFLTYTCNEVVRVKILFTLRTYRACQFFILERERRNRLTLTQNC